MVDSSAAGVWKKLQEDHDVSSESMDELLAMVGLERVKLFCVDLFKIGFAYDKMSERDKEVNVFSGNFALIGNPGTGKSVVAELIGDILEDSDLKSVPFIQTTAQKLKDDGIASFRKMIDSPRIIFIVTCQCHNLG